MMDDEDDVPTAPFWMATFSDMMTLLMTFFVMLVAMSEVEVNRFQQALTYFQGSTGILSQQTPATPQTPLAPPKPTPQQLKQYRTFMAYLEANNLTENVQVTLTERGIHVVITDSLMFKTGGADLIDSSRDILHMVAGLVDDSVKAVVVEGHTDDRPIQTPHFPSNWELSSARAASAVRFLLRHPRALDPSRYVAVGYGPYRPVMPGTSARARARNRRVEILLSWTSWTNRPQPLTDPLLKTPERLPPPSSSASL